MRVLLLGAGALGSLFGARLQNSECTPVLFGLNTDHLQAVAEHGLYFDELDGTRTCRQVKICLTLEAMDQPPDVVLVLVKSYATDAAVASVVRYCHEKTVFVTVQNGMGNWEQIAAHVPIDRILAGVTAQAATMVGPGHIRHGGNGPTVLGAVQEPAPMLLSSLVRLFNEAGLACSATNRVMDHIWSKLFVNIGINAVTALTAVPNGWIAQCVSAREIAQAAVQEAIQVAKAHGRQPNEDVVDKVMSVAEATAANHSSMLQDLQGFRRTEVEAINGIVCRWGREAGVPTPVNSVLSNLIHVVEQRNMSL